MNLHKYTKDQLIDSIKNKTSIRQVLLSLNVAPYGGNYDTIKKAIKYYNLDTSHFTGQRSNKGKKFPLKRPLTDYTSNNFPIQSNKLRLRLLRENIFSHICDTCNNSKWMNKPIPLELDHINGNNKDNSLTNLRLLCPNCNAQTPTYRGRNIKNKSSAFGGSRSLNPEGDRA